jgi:pyrroline-5-carboxylate reductase
VVGGGDMADKMIGQVVRHGENKHLCMIKSERGNVHVLILNVVTEKS